MRRDKLIGVLFLMLVMLGAMWLSAILFFSNLPVTLRIPTAVVTIPIFIVLLAIGLKLLIREPIEPISPKNLYMEVLKMYKGPRCIAISGIDGAGKSTQLQMLSRILEDLGISYSVVWFRWPAFSVYPFLAIARLLGYTIRLESKRKDMPTGTVYIIHKYYKNKALAKVISRLLIVDFTTMFITRILIPLKILRLKRWILCDRFILDLVADVYAWTRELSIFDRTMLVLYRKFLLTCPTILLDVEEDEALHRKQDIPSIMYLKTRRRLYGLMAKIFDLVVISTGHSSKGETLKNILKAYKIEGLMELRKLARAFESC